MAHGLGAKRYRYRAAIALRNEDQAADQLPNTSPDNSPSNRLGAQGRAQPIRRGGSETGGGDNLFTVTVLVGDRACSTTGAAIAVKPGDAVTLPSSAQQSSSVERPYQHEFQNDR
jgi:hypothetical protein